MKEQILIDFLVMPWRKVVGNGRAGRIKEQEIPDGRVRMLEFSKNWNERTWCARPHIGYILSGKLQLDFKKKSEKVEVRKGQGFVIREGQLHKASCKSAARAFIVG